MYNSATVLGTRSVHPGPGRELFPVLEQLFKDEPKAKLKPCCSGLCIVHDRLTVPSCSLTPFNCILSVKTAVAETGWNVYLMLFNLIPRSCGLCHKHSPYFVLWTTVLNSGGQGVGKEHLC